ncbi:MAG: radical SAM protein [Endomicrobiaceae bacterium]
MKKILLINPPVYDFAAYDLWAKPLSLLYLSSLLKEQHIDIMLFDYMDRNLYQDSVSKSNKYGCGHYIKQEVIKPDKIKNIKRNYYRFGIPADAAEDFFNKIEAPDIIIINSVMTYWYPGIKEAAETLSKIFPKIPLILGGIYATLCEEHAKSIKGVTDVIAGDLSKLNKLFFKFNIPAVISNDFHKFPYPDYSFYKNLQYIATRISLGCPFNCMYCAQKYLNNGSYNQKTPETIKNEIYNLTDNGKIRNIAFYDDALLYKPDESIKPLLKQFIKDDKNFYLHTPNGLHARFLDLELADLMFNAKFINPRFSLETSDYQEQKNSDNKITNTEFTKCMKYLNSAGYKQGEYTAYLLIGTPEQNINAVKESILFVHNLGAKISLSEYTPIPHTKSWSDIDTIYTEEPLRQNNTYFISQLKEYEKILEIKKLAKDLNNKL